MGDSFSAALNANPYGWLKNCTEEGEEDESASVSGPGFDACVPGACKRNSGSYGYQFAKKYAPDSFWFTACSGAMTTDCLEEQVDVFFPLARPEAEGIKVLNSNDLVTITIGGNDVLFVDTILYCVYANHGWRDWFTDCGEWMSKADSAIAMMELPGSNLDMLFRKLSKNNPQVVVFGYPRFVGEVECTEEPLSWPSDDERARLNELVPMFNSLLERRAEQYGFTYVDVDGDFEGHRYCDYGEPWFQSPWNNPGGFHPTTKGQMVYMRALERALGCT